MTVLFENKLISLNTNAKKNLLSTHVKSTHDNNKLLSSKDKMHHSCFARIYYCRSLKLRKPFWSDKHSADVLDKVLGALFCRIKSTGP